MAIDIEPVHPFVGAEIRGVQINRPLDQETINEIHAAIDRHAVVFFRNQNLQDEQQMAFAKRFGELERYAISYKKDMKLRLNNSAMVDISNLDSMTGEVQARDARLRMVNLAARVWHTDSSFRLPIGALSMLYAHKIPPAGGETEFADMRAAYDALPSDWRGEIEGMQVEHSMIDGYERVFGISGFQDYERENLPPVVQPLVRIHPRSGRKALYMGWTAMRVLGAPTVEGRVLMFDLTDFATQRPFVYSHTWRVGDLVIWDNRSVMHRGRRYDESYVRDMRRVTTMDTGVEGQAASAVVGQRSPETVGMGAKQ